MNQNDNSNTDLESEALCLIPELLLNRLLEASDIKFNFSRVTNLVRRSVFSPFIFGILLITIAFVN